MERRRGFLLRCPLSWDDGLYGSGIESFQGSSLPPELYIHYLSVPSCTAGFGYVDMCLVVVESFYTPTPTPSLIPIRRCNLPCLPGDTLGAVKGQVERNIPTPRVIPVRSLWICAVVLRTLDTHFFNLKVVEPWRFFQKFPFVVV